MFARFKSSGNQTWYNRRKPGNRFGILTWAQDRSVYNSRSVVLYDIDLCRSSEMYQVDQYMLRVFLFCIMIRIDRSVRPCNFGSIDPAWSNPLLIIFKNYNFKGIIVILKIISLMERKVYEISLKGHSYHFFALKNQFSPKIILNFLFCSIYYFFFLPIHPLFLLWITLLFTNYTHSLLENYFFRPK